MPVEFYKRGPAISAADVAAFEARIGRALPADYSTFLLTYNGGRPSFHVIRNTSRGDLGVKIFYGLWDKEYFDLDAEYRNMRDRWPTRLISVAIDDCGNRFCLSVEPPDFGSVYFWDHEEEVEEGDEPTELNLYHVADSFVEFWNRMEPINPDEYLAEADSPIDAEPQQPSSDVPPPTTNGAPS
jgi:hypothetical protein